MAQVAMIRVKHARFLAGTDSKTKFIFENNEKNVHKCTCIIVTALLWGGGGVSIRQLQYLQIIMFNGTVQRFKTPDCPLKFCPSVQELNSPKVPIGVYTVNCIL